MALAGGLTAGIIISIAVTLSVQAAVSDVDTVENGVEAGEAASKLIAALFVIPFSLKLPQWFGISNYVSENKKKREAIIVGEPSHTPVEIDAEKGETAADIKPEPEDSLFSLGISLFWNSMREFSEGGCFTGIVSVLSADAMDQLAASVGTGVAAAIVVGIIMYLGAKYISPYGFGIAATAIAICLSSGLTVGSVKSFEEVYAVNHDDRNSGTLCMVDDATTEGNVLGVFQFMGISTSMTKLTCAFFVACYVLLCFAQYWHNYLGYRFFPSLATIKELWNGKKAEKDKESGDASMETMEVVRD